MQHSKKKTDVASAPQKQAQQPVRPVAQAPTPSPAPSTPKAVPVQQNQQTQVKTQPAPSQNFMADIMAGKVVPQQSTPKPPQQPVVQQQTEVEQTPIVEEKKSYISNKDKFEALSKENPLLDTLKKKFDLNFKHMICFPNAKINIGLRITEKRPDEYHNIETIFYPVHGLCDCLEFMESNELKFENVGIQIDTPPEKNLCVKAWNIFHSHYDIPPIHILLYKHIPFGGGLGGGSADASFLLSAINEHF